MIQRGQVYWVQLDPTIGSEINRTRPAIVVSNDISNQYADTVTVLPITSKTGTIHPFEVVIPAGTGGLKHTSKVKANQIRTVDKRRLGAQPLGTQASEEILQQINNALQIHLAIN